MKYRYFYTIVTAAAVLLCIPGCSEGASENTSSKTVLSESSEEDSDSKQAVETTISTLTPLQTFIRITGFPEKTDKSSEAESFFEKEENIEAITDYSDQWFSAHTIFTMKMREEENSSSENETWFRFSWSSETTATKASVEKPDIKISGFKENND